MKKKSGSREEKSWSLIHVRSYSARNGVFWFTAPVILCLDLLRNLGNCLIQWKIQSQRLNKPRRNFFNKWTMSRKSHWKSARLSATCRFKTPSSYRWVPAQARAAQFKGKSRHFVVFTSKIDRSSIFLQFFFVLGFTENSFPSHSFPPAHVDSLAPATRMAPTVASLAPALGWHRALHSCDRKNALTSTTEKLRASARSTRPSPYHSPMKTWRWFWTRTASSRTTTSSAIRCMWPCHYRICAPHHPRQQGSLALISSSFGQL